MRENNLEGIKGKWEYCQQKVAYAFYTMIHPGDGFYEIRHRGRGSVGLSLIIVILFAISFSLNKRYANFIVNPYNTQYINSFIDLLAILALFFLFCVSNWSVTCLMEGEGRMKDIVACVGYSLLPLVCTLLPATAVSYLIAADEEAFYFVLLAFAIGWFLILVIKAIMTVQNFTLGKTFVTLIFTFVAMLIIIFLTVLLTTILQQMLLFFRSTYMELIFSV